jgi:hypothetical protein
MSGLLTLRVLPPARVPPARPLCALPDGGWIGFGFGLVSTRRAAFPPTIATTLLLPTSYCRRSCQYTHIHTDAHAGSACCRNTAVLGVFVRSARHATPQIHAHLMDGEETTRHGRRWLRIPGRAAHKVVLGLQAHAVVYDVRVEAHQLDAALGVLERLRVRA